MIFFKLILYFILSILVWNIFTLKYTNPYKLTMIFGKKGAGKTTLLVKLAYKHIKRGWTVYSTENIPGTRFVDYHDIGIYHFPDVDYVPFDPDDYRGIVRVFKSIRHWFFPYRPKVLLLIDAVGLVWNNRDYKKFGAHVRRWFKLQRHYNTKVYMFSQAFDVDKQLRDLTDQMYLIKNSFRIFSYGKRIIKNPTLKENQEDGSGNIVDDLRFDPFIFFMFGSRMLTFIPRWSKLFNSFVIDELPVREYRETPWNPDLINPTKRFNWHKRRAACLDDVPDDVPDDSDAAPPTYGNSPYGPDVPEDFDFIPESPDDCFDDFLSDQLAQYPEYPGPYTVPMPLPDQDTDKPVKKPGVKSGSKSAPSSGKGTRKGKS